MTLQRSQKKLYLFYEVLNIGNILKSEIVQAIEQIYLRPLINKNTNKIDGIICDCFNHLFQKFGQIYYMTVKLL